MAFNSVGDWIFQNGTGEKKLVKIINSTWNPKNAKPSSAGTRALRLVSTCNQCDGALNNYVNVNAMMGIFFGDIQARVSLVVKRPVGSFPGEGSNAISIRSKIAVFVFPA